MPNELYGWYEDFHNHITTLLTQHLSHQLIGRREGRGTISICHITTI